MALNYHVVDYPTGLPADQLSSQLSAVGADGWKLVRIVDAKQNQRRATFVSGENPTEYLVVDTAVGRPPADLESMLDSYGADGWLLNSIDMLQQAGRRVVFSRTQFPSATQTFDYRFDTNNNPGPNNGDVRWDNDTAMLAAYVWVNNITDGGTDVSNVLMGLKVNDQIYIQDKNDATKYFIFHLTAAPVQQSGYVEYAVAWDQSGTGGNLGNRDPIVLSVGGGGTVGGGGGGITDAPLGGLTYGRQSAAWVQAIAANNDVLDGGSF